MFFIWDHGLQVNGSDEVTLKGSESARVHLQRCATWALGAFQLNLLRSSEYFNGRGICDFDMAGEYVSTDMFLIMFGDRSLFTPISCISCRA
ncbi:hypothetical protein N7501_002229 [Penicillium viridicatum]|nr:hypothetical protein N7501_002229 [Penicillium viridicatum]